MENSRWLRHLASKEANTLILCRPYIIDISNNLYSTKFKEPPMPIFEYQCNHCKKEFEKLVFAGEEGKILCPCTSSDITKKMSATSFMGASIGTCAADAPKQFS